MGDTNKDLRVYWLWLPIAIMAVQIGLEIFLPNDTLHKLHTENGSHEIFQFLILSIGFLVCLHYLFFRKPKTFARTLIFILGALACLYVGGEEISWGQHVFGWSTPEEWAALNDQGETNLHNTSSWLDQKPRALLEIGIVLTTLIYPLIQRFRTISLPAWLSDLMPPLCLSVIGFFVIVPKLIEKVFEAFDIVLFTRFSEVQEIYMYLFVLLYLVMLSRKELPAGR